MQTEFLKQYKDTRLARNITLEEIAAHTRINVKFLQAIEEGRLEVLPEIYIRIFLKNYVAYLGMDTRPVLAELDRLRTPESADTEGEAPSQQPPGPDPDTKTTEDHLDPLKRLFPFVLGIILIFFFGYFIVGKLVKKAPPAALSPPAEKAPPQPAVRAPNLGTPAVPVPDTTIRLAVRGIKHCWILAVKDGQDTLYADFIKQGQAKDFTARQDIFIKIGLSEGDSAAVALNLNGKDLGNWGQAGTRLTKLTVTPEGIDQSSLVVKKIQKQATTDSLPDSDPNQDE